MNKVLFILITTALSLNSFSKDYKGSKASEVWEEVTSTPYLSLPTKKISYLSLFKGLKSKIKLAANRTLSNKSDLLPYFDKLAHPNGVCLKGTWNITEENPYTGLYKKGTKAIIITRSSVALSKTTVGKNRGFGMAGKIFPTLDEEQTVKTANFFLVDDLGGTKAPHYTGVEMTNEPVVSKNLTVIRNLAYSLKLALTFGKADSNPGIRQLYQISETNTLKDAITPKWMMVKARSGQNINENDFRDELNIDNRASNLFFDIYVTSKEVREKKQWQKLGYIEFSESIASDSCDHRLHFNHPKWKTNLKHK
ncbi:hypothetical protein [Halobacteriovorax sp.]|uniref:hypothetical protein n=1 Tax=Halobacteriovorax sp. TaxID=2020862 RepID=UPI003561A0AA